MFDKMNVQKGIIDIRAITSAWFYSNPSIFKFTLDVLYVHLVKHLLYKRDTSSRFTNKHTQQTLESLRLWGKTLIPFWQNSKPFDLTGFDGFRCRFRWVSILM